MMKLWPLPADPLIRWALAVLVAVLVICAAIGLYNAVAHAQPSPLGPSQGGPVPAACEPYITHIQRLAKTNDTIKSVRDFYEQKISELAVDLEKAQRDLAQIKAAQAPAAQPGPQAAPR